MTSENITMLRELYQLLQAGIITKEDFNIKKAEFIAEKVNISAIDKIKFLQDLHQLMQEGILTEAEFTSVKQEILNSSSIREKSTVSGNESGYAQNITVDEPEQSNQSHSSGNINLENTVNEIKIDDLHMKLTNDKLYVNSATSNETFALRSVNGIGIVDLVEKFNQDLELWKKGNTTYKSLGYFFIIVGIISLLIGIGDSIFLGAGIVVLILGIYYFKNAEEKPILKSSVRIMLSGTQRDFEFDKKSTNAGQVARFVALVEDTLTAYHKKN